MACAESYSESLAMEDNKEHFSNDIASFPGLPRFLFFGFHSV